MQKMKFFIVFLVLGMGFFWLNSCEKYTLTDNPLSASDSVKFSKDIKPIFTSEGCTSCHNGSLSPNLKDNPHQSLLSYVNTKSPKESRLYVQLTTNHSGKVSPTELQKILFWITQGAKDN